MLEVFKIDETSDFPYYQQLYQFFKRAKSTGVPSFRETACNIWDFCNIGYDTDTIAIIAFLSLKILTIDNNQLLIKSNSWLLLLLGRIN